MDQIKAGDVVVLKSGGPKMTVSKIGIAGGSDTTSAWCDWFEGTKPQKGVFPLTSLQVFEEGRGPRAW